ncbi:MAG: hypothetical protein R3Y32_06890 [Bacillota bacterium]
MTIKIWFLTIKFGNKLTSYEKNYIKMLIRLYKTNIRALKNTENKKPYETEIIRIKGRIDGVCEILQYRAEFSQTSDDVKIFKKNNLIKL